MEAAYANIITLNDLIRNARGWDAAVDCERPSVTRMRVSDLIPAAATILPPTSSVTLSRQQVDGAQKLPSEVMLRVRCNSIFLAAVKFATQFNPPITWTIESSAIVALWSIVTPACFISISVGLTDLQGIPSHQVNQAIEYTIPKITQAEGSKKSTIIDFLADGRIQRSSDSTTVTSDRTPPTPGIDKDKIKKKIQLIESQPVIAEGWISAEAFSQIFSGKKTGSSGDRFVDIIPNDGITLRNTGSGSDIRLHIPCNPTDESSRATHIVEKPTKALTGSIILSGFPNLGKCGTSQSSVTLTFYDKTLDTYYVKITIQFSHLSVGSVYAQVIARSKDVPTKLEVHPAQAPSATPAAEDEGDLDFLDS